MRTLPWQILPKEGALSVNHRHHEPYAAGLVSSRGRGPMRLAWLLRLQAEDEAHRGPLARTVRAEEAGHHPPADDEVETIDRKRVP